VWPVAIWSLKNRIREAVLRNIDEVEGFACNLWSELTVHELQLVFQEWMRRLEWVCEHEGESVPV
jgi:hypothetical protein